MESYFVNNEGSELILFFLGWGMDYRPLLPLKSKRDIQYFYNYQNLDYKLVDNYSKYQTRYVIGYSAGVSISKLLKLKNIEKYFMINGTINLFDKKYGLNEDILRIFRSINLDNYMDFRRDYLVLNKKELDFFNKNQPLRSVESSMNELNALEKFDYSKISKKDYKNDKIYFSKLDKVFNFENQKEFYEGFEYEIIQANHFPFCKFASIDEIIEK